MNVRGLLRPVRRLWPRKVRTRLTLIYAALFFAAGAALLTLTYGLVASNLPTTPSPAVARVSSQELNALSRECQPLGGLVKGTKGKPTNVDVKSLNGCKVAESAYYAGTAAGMTALRQNTLAKLLGFWLLGLGIMTVVSGGLG